MNTNRDTIPHPHIHTSPHIHTHAHPHTSTHPQVAIVRIKTICNLKSIVIVPFVALVSERVTQWRERWGRDAQGKEGRMRVKAFHGNRGTLRDFQKVRSGVMVSG